MKVWELLNLLATLNEDDEVVVWNEAAQRYLAAEGVRAEDGRVEVAAVDPGKVS